MGQPAILATERWVTERLAIEAPEAPEPARPAVELPVPAVQGLAEELELLEVAAPEQAARVVEEQLTNPKTMTR